MFVKWYPVRVTVSQSHARPQWAISWGADDGMWPNVTQGGENDDIDKG